MDNAIVRGLVTYRCWPTKASWSVQHEGQIDGTNVEEECAENFKQFFIPKLHWWRSNPTQLTGCCSGQNKSRVTSLNNICVRQESESWRNMMSPCAFCLPTRNIFPLVWLFLKRLWSYWMSPYDETPQRGRDICSHNIHISLFVLFTILVIVSA